MLDSRPDRIYDIKIANGMGSRFTTGMNDSDATTGRDFSAYALTLGRILWLEPLMQTVPGPPVELPALSLSDVEPWFPVGTAVVAATKAKLEEVQQARRNLDGELFIDRLLGCFGVDVKNGDDHDNNDDHGTSATTKKQWYPPKNRASMLELVRTIIDNEQFEEIQKHCIVYYLLKEDGNHRRPLDYAKEFMIPVHFQLLMDGYWAMDHGRFQVWESAGLACFTITSQLDDFPHFVSPFVLLGFAYFPPPLPPPPSPVQEAVFFFSDPLVEADWPEKIFRTLYHRGCHSEANFFLNTVRPTLKDPADLALQMDLLIEFNLTEAFEFQVGHAWVPTFLELL